MLVEALLAEPADEGGARPSQSLLAALAGGTDDAQQRLSELAQQTRLDKRSFELEDFYALRPEAAEEKNKVKLSCSSPTMRKVE
jgi:hypothetical protein